MQYGDPGTSSIDQPGRIRSNSPMSPRSVRPISRPVALRRQTPIRYTQSIPFFARLSHAPGGTFASVIVLPARADSCSSHGHALISYRWGWARTSAAGGALHFLHRGGEPARVVAARRLEF